MRTRNGLVAALVFFYAAGDARPAAALPDLTPEIFDVGYQSSGSVDPGDVVEGCAGAEFGRKLIRFSIRTRNIGATDFNLGVPGCPDCSTHPNAACANPAFVCSASHGHPHFNSFVRAELLNGSAVVAVGRKQGFCLLDLECANPKFSCGNQGISAGCSDVYSASLPCQYIDITNDNLPEGDYTLRVTLDPDLVIAESSEANNVATAPVHVGELPPPALSCPVIMSTDIPKAIPDFGFGHAVSTLPVTLGGQVTRVRIVDLKGTHTYVGDLEVHLANPQGVDVDVLHKKCAGAQNFDLDLVDGGDLLVNCPMTTGQVVRPYLTMSTFNGQVAAGTWELRVFDQATRDTGNLNSWGLEICTTCGNGVVNPGEVCDDGNTLDGDCCSSTCLNAAPNGVACAAPADCLVGTCNAGQCAGSLSCDPCLACVPGGGCQVPPAALCDGMLAGDSWVALKRNATDASRDALGWSLQSGSPIALLDFGNPQAVTNMHLCLYDQRGLQLSLTAPAAGLCGGGPCWSQTALGYKYVDPELTPDGLGRILLQAGDSYRARMYARGKGPNLGLPDLTLQSPVTVRLKRSGGPACWEATYPTAASSTALKFKARR